ncbi:phage tail tape measure C-terminal domain-containing protein [Thalassospira alkalitolerans]|uniref:phage tail tape measure C-terminal domain-containing protein n=1 Tax=Thalassospira alkalitolerans TaxID=1293890 RepID=UPI0030EEAEA5|tara:strand:+ start:32915 stop:35485 length:2571 start_codon:yes stop_codon:yes gene_type:complete
MTERNLTIRLAIRDGDVVRRALTQLGDEGSRALTRIENASKPASRGLLALGEVTSAARGRLEGFAGNLGGVGSAMLRLGPAGIAAGAAVGAITLALGQGLRELEMAEQSFLRLEGILKATGHASGLTSAQLAELADTMEMSTLATAEGVMDAASVLATFRSISGDTFLRTIKAAQDLSSVFGQDLRSSAVQLGKALEDPVEGVTALKRVGVTFSASQRDMIASMVETGDVAGAQALILKTLEQQVGGAGEAEAGGLTGAVHHLKSAWGNLLEELARTPGVGGMVESTLKGLTATLDGVRGWFQGPNISQQVATKSRELVDAEERLAELRSGSVLWDPSYGLRINQATAAAQAKVDRLKTEIDALIEQGRAEVDAFQTEQDQASAGRRQAEQERNAETIAARIKALEAERVKAAVDVAEKIAAINDQLARDIVSAEKKSGLPGIDAADVDREITLLRDIATRKIEAIERPVRAAAERTSDQARKLIADLERQLGAANDPRNAAVDQAISRLPASATETERREVERLSGALFDQKLAIEELNKELEAEAKLRDKGAEITRRHRTAEEEYRDVLAELGNLLANAAIDQQTYARAVEEVEQRKLDASKEWRDGAVRAVRDYVEEASNAARTAEQAVTKSLQAGEDAFVKWATTGKLAVGDLFNTMAEEALRAAWRMSVIKPFGGMLEGLFSSIGSGIAGWFTGGSTGGTIAPSDPGLILEAHSGGVVGHDALRRRDIDPGLFRSAERFHGGGLVGLRSGEVPIVALRGEEVLTRDDPRHRFNLAGSQSGVTVVVQPTVTNTVPNTQARTETRRGPGGELMIDVFVEQMEMLMSRKIGRGEGMAPTLERRYGLNPAAGAYR